jgi:hypothetical protein
MPGSGFLATTIKEAFMGFGLMQHDEYGRTMLRLG